MRKNSIFWRTSVRALRYSHWIQLGCCETETKHERERYRNREREREREREKERERERERERESKKALPLVNPKEQEATKGRTKRMGKKRREWENKSCGAW